jgi:hypothetical protein
MTIPYAERTTQLIQTIREIMPVPGQFTYVTLPNDYDVPQEYRMLVEKYPLLEFDNFAIFDLVDHPYKRWNITKILVHLEQKYSPIFTEFFPVSEIREGVLIAIDRVDNSVRIVDLDSAIARTHRPQVAHTFLEFVYHSLLGVMTRLQAIQTAWQKLERHVTSFAKEYEYSHSKGGKLPRNHNWRPYRYCIQDVFFGLSVVRHNRKHNYLEVDVCLTAFVPGYDALAGAEALLVFFLTEAFKCGGTMAIQFTKHVEDGQVPADIEALAARHQVKLLQRKNGTITATEAIQLYMRLSRFSPKLQQILTRLHDAQQLSIPRACFAVHHGLWNADQIEMFAIGSKHPDAILSGVAQVQHRHAFNYALYHARAALLIDAFERALLYRQHESKNAQNVSDDREDDRYLADTIFDDNGYIKAFHTKQILPLPWSINTVSNLKVLRFQVMIRARDAADIKRHLIYDVALAEYIRQQEGIDTFLLVPRDYYDLSNTFQKAMEEELTNRGVVLLVAPDHSMTYDQEAMKRLSRSRLVRK